jgi:UDP-glucose 4-epimerase
MKPYLVTGGCGFIGSHLVDALIAAGQRVRVLDDLSTGTRDHLPAEVDLIIADVSDARAVAAATTGVAGCFHLAAIASVERCNQDWPGTHRVNLGGQINILDAARLQGFPVVYASSAAVYGDQPVLPLRETAVARPWTAYGADKLGCEQHARAGAIVHGLRSAGLRFFNVYGPRQQLGSPYSGVISIFADRIARGAPITIHGDGTQSRDFIFVADVVTALLAAMRHLEREQAPTAEIVNICTGNAVTIRELCTLLMESAGRSTSFNHVPVRKGDIRHSLGDPTHAAERLSFRAQALFADGLALTYRALVAADRLPRFRVSPANKVA